ncbi:hypothetical protein [Agromyces larvae]|uniref:Uncharacterized protein n=1 Tax=Agromyces larvae TaxID=2929802 RepID=A0ABY4C7H8_9MICO|nr:hypothetical protein [Agromyces larvae]UOE45958.1 hypothetical protein MTO99_09515 [Agromyces larvae]
MSATPTRPVCTCGTPMRPAATTLAEPNPSSTLHFCPNCDVPHGTVPTGADHSFENSWRRRTRYTRGNDNPKGPLK